ncbi:hypothetical protein JB92DRAFT_3282844 [Gautieria morchelliformis]|nr:hypothetical protein JB92DRAFT_3282844 [Gautieria morchelliformis]
MTWHLHRLKYHLVHGVCCFTPRDPVVKALRRASGSGWKGGGCVQWMGPSMEESGRGGEENKCCERWYKNFNGLHKWNLSGLQPRLLPAQAAAACGPCAVRAVACALRCGARKVKSRHVHDHDVPAQCYWPTRGIHASPALHFGGQLRSMNSGEERLYSSITAVKTGHWTGKGDAWQRQTLERWCDSDSQTTARGNPRDNYKECRAMAKRTEKYGEGKVGKEETCQQRKKALPCHLKQARTGQSDCKGQCLQNQSCNRELWQRGCFKIRQGNLKLRWTRGMKRKLSAKDKEMRRTEPIAVAATVYEFIQVSGRTGGVTPTNEKVRLHAKCGKEMQMSQIVTNQSSLVTLQGSQRRPKQYTSYA